MKPKSIFITGGAGFIGRAIVKIALENEIGVTVFDNLSFGKLKNIEEFENKVNFIKGDILDSAHVIEAVSDAKPDAVIHLAALHYIPYCNDNPSMTIRVNVEGTYNVLNAASKAGVKKAVLASTGAIYRSTEEPLSESSETPEPVDVYGLSKLQMEQAARYFGTTTSLKCICARLFNTYGPYETNMHLIPHIMESLKKSNEIQLGNIYTKRDYVFVEDIARTILLCTELKSSGFDIYNIGTGIEYSAQEIIQILEGLTSRKIIIHTDQSRLRKADKMHQIADKSRITAASGYSPIYNLNEGMKALLRHEGLI